MDWRLKDRWHSLKAAARLAPRALTGQPGLALTYFLLKHSGLDPFEDYKIDPPLGARIVKKHSIASLTYLDPGIDAQIVPDANLVLVLVEKRLLNEQPTALKGPQGDAGRSRDLGDGETASLRAPSRQPRTPTGACGQPWPHCARTSMTPLTISAGKPARAPSWSPA